MSPLAITVTCAICEQDQAPIVIPHGQLKAWVHGLPANEAFPELEPFERELLISATCDRCWQRLWLIDEED